MKNNLVEIYVILDMMKKIMKGNIEEKTIAIGSGSLFESITKEYNLTKMGIKKIITVSKKTSRILLKKWNIKCIKYSDIKVIDCYVGSVKECGENFFYKGYKGMISKESLLYYKAKKRIIVTQKLKDISNKNIPLECINSLKEFIHSTLKKQAKKVYIKKNKRNKGLFTSEDLLNIITFRLNNNNDNNNRKIKKDTINKIAKKEKKKEEEERSNKKTKKHKKNSRKNESNRENRKREIIKKTIAFSEVKEKITEYKYKKIKEDSKNQKDKEKNTTIINDKLDKTYQKIKEIRKIKGVLEIGFFGLIKKTYVIKIGKNNVKIKK